VTPTRDTRSSARPLRAIRGDAERLRQFNLPRAQPHLARAHRELKRHLIVDPRRDPLRGHLQPQLIPTPLLELHALRRLILRRVVAIQAAQPDHLAIPSAIDPRAECVEHRKCDAREEIVALKARSFHADFVICLRKLAVPVDARHRRSRAQNNRAVLHFHRTLARERRLLPALERLAVEDRRPLRLLCESSNRDHRTNQQLCFHLCVSAPPCQFPSGVMLVTSGLFASVNFSNESGLLGSNPVNSSNTGTFNSNSSTFASTHFAIS